MGFFFFYTNHRKSITRIQMIMIANIVNTYKHFYQCKNYKEKK